MKKLIIELDKELHQEFKVLCTKQGVTMKEKVTEFMKKEVEKHERSKGKDQRD